MPQQILERRSLVLLLIGFLIIALVLAALPLTTALFIAGAFALIAALFLYPQVAVYLVVFAVPFGSLLPLNLGAGNLTAADVFLLLAWMLYLARGIARRNLSLRLPRLALPFFIFIFAAGLSFTISTSLGDSITELVKRIEMFAAYWLVAQFFDETQTERLLMVMFAAGLSEALLGAYQFYYQVGPEGFLLFGGTNLRAYGTFEQPNPYAGYLGILIPLAFGTAVAILRLDGRPQTDDGAMSPSPIGRGARGEGLSPSSLFSPPSSVLSEAERPPSPVLRQLVLLVLALISLAAMLAALFFSYSRGAWIGVTAAVGVTAVLTLVRSKRAAVFVLALVLAAIVVIALGEINVVPDIITERFATVGDYFGFQDVRGVNVNDDNFAIVERMAHWQAALSMFQASPWLGVGFGNYATVYPKYSLPFWDDPLGHAHNYYLNVLAEAGIIGLLAYLILWSAVFWYVGHAARSWNGWQQGVLAGAFGVLVALSIHNFFDNLFVHAMYIQVGLMLGVVEVITEPS